MNRHSNEGAGSSVPSRSKNAPTVSAPTSTAITLSPQAPSQPAPEVSFAPPRDTGAPPTPPAQPAQCRKSPSHQPEFARSAKAKNVRMRPASPHANARPAPAIPDNKNTRTSESHTPRDSHAMPPAPAPTKFHESNCFQTRCAPRDSPARAENR